MPQGKAKSLHASLTEAFCRRLKPATAPAVLDCYSTSVPNLSLRVTPPSKVYLGGLKTWRFAGRFEGKQFVITIGRHPDWPSEEAHKRAREIQVILDKGLSPRQVLFPRQEPAPAATTLPPADTVQQMFERYEPTLDEKSGRHQRAVRSYFERFVLPTLGERSVHMIKKRDIADLLKTVKDRSGPVAANRCATAISAWFAFLIRDGILEASPATKLPKTEEKERQRCLSMDELVLVWRAAEAMGGPAGRFVQLLLAVPVRRDEASALPWAEIRGSEWVVPAVRNKSGRDFLIPLTSLARSILDRCDDTGGFVFSLSGSHPITGFSRIKRALDSAIDKLQGPLAQPLERFTFHDLRRSIRTHLARLGVSDAIGERLLNHQMDKLRRTYDVHDYKIEKAAALELWSDCMLRALAAAPCEVPDLEAAE
jgi:integrase